MTGHAIHAGIWRPIMRFALLALLLLPFSAVARNWNVDMAHSTLTFKCSYQNGPFEGVFHKFEPKISYDEGDLAHSKFDVTVNLSSVDTQSSERDQTLLTPDFFDTAKYPQAHFIATDFMRNGNGGVDAKGTLTIRGISKPVTLHVNFAVTNGKTMLNVSTVLNRLDFGLGTDSDWADIARNVDVRGHLVLIPK